MSCVFLCRWWSLCVVVPKAVGAVHSIRHLPHQHLQKLAYPPVPVVPGVAAGDLVVLVRCARLAKRLDHLPVRGDKSRPPCRSRCRCKERPRDAARQSSRTRRSLFASGCLRVRRSSRSDPPRPCRASPPAPPARVTPNAPLKLPATENCAGRLSASFSAPKPPIDRPAIARPYLELSVRYFCTTSAGNSVAT